MTVEEFRNSTFEIAAQADWPVHVRSLWYVAHDNWQAAHNLIDHLDDAKSSHVHAYLHRLEGDEWNAKYWYNRANQPVFKGSLEEEWIALVTLYLV